MSYDGSMSVNAREAYAADRKPISRITKQDILKYGVDESISFFQWYIRHHCNSNEWHHTSSRLNETTFYDIEACCNQFKRMDIDKLKSQYKARPKKAKKVPDSSISDIPYYAQIEYSISTFRNGRKYLDTYAVIHRCWAYFHDDFHKKIVKKKITGSHFKIKEKYQSRPDEISEDTNQTIFKIIKKE